MTPEIETARLRVMRSRWIPLYLCILLLPAACAAHRNLPRYRGEVPAPTVTNPQTE